MIFVIGFFCLVVGSVGYQATCGGSYQPDPPTADAFIILALLGLVLMLVSLCIFAVRWLP